MSTEFYPAFCSIRYYIHFAVLNSKLEHFCGCLLQKLDVLLDHSAELYVLIDTGRVDETCAEESIIPIEDDRSLVRFGLLLRREPNLLVRQFAEQIHA